MCRRHAAHEGNNPQGLTPGVLGGDLTALVSYVWLGRFKWRRQCNCRIVLMLCPPVPETSLLFLFILFCLL